MTGRIDLGKVTRAIDRIATAKNHSQADVAAVLGLSRETWNRCLNINDGRSLGHVTFGRLVDLADVLQVDGKAFFE